MSAIFHFEGDRSIGIVLANRHVWIFGHRVSRTRGWKAETLEILGDKEDAS